MTDKEQEGLALCQEARDKGTSADMTVGEIIYNNIFARDTVNYRDWKTASYQAPETHEGFAFHLCIYTAIQIRTLTPATDAGDKAE